MNRLTNWHHSFGMSNKFILHRHFYGDTRICWTKSIIYQEYKQNRTPLREGRSKKFPSQQQCYYICSIKMSYFFSSFFFQTNPRIVENSSSWSYYSVKLCCYFQNHEIQPYRLINLNKLCLPNASDKFSSESSNM